MSSTKCRASWNSAQVSYKPCNLLPVKRNTRSLESSTFKVSPLDKASEDTVAVPWQRTVPKADCFENDGPVIECHDLRAGFEEEEAVPTSDVSQCDTE